MRRSPRQRNWQPHIAVLPLVSALACAMLASSAAAQEQGTAMGDVNRAMGGVDSSVHAEAVQSRAPSSVGGGARGAIGSVWAAKPGHGVWGTRSGQNDEAAGSWSLAHKRPQSAFSGPAAGAAAASAPMFSPLGGKQEKARPETASNKQKGVKSLPMPAESGGPATREPFAFTREPFAFTGKVNYASGSSHEARRKFHEKLASQLKGGHDSPRLVRKAKPGEIKEKPARGSPTQDESACGKSSLKLCTWVSGR